MTQTTETSGARRRGPGASPGYIEAASEQARTLYLRHGYSDAPGGPIELPDGAVMHPMIRLPRTD